MKPALDIHEYVNITDMVFDDIICHNEPRDYEIEDEHVAFIPQSITLHNRYDHNQLWLDFGVAVIYRLDDSYKKRFYRYHNSNIKPKQNDNLITPTNKGMYCYSTEPQYLLPFDEFRELEFYEFMLLAKNDYPVWDRDNNGDIFNITMPFNDNRHLTQFKKWVIDHAPGRFYLTKYNDKHICYFSHQAAFVLVDMLSRGGEIIEIITEYGNDQ